MGPRIRNLALAALLVLFGAARVDAATTRTVCASGCDFTNSQLQQAIDATAAGDTILLQTNFTYAGLFFLKAFSCAANNSTCYATIRTGVTSAGVVMATSNFPAPNIRIDPSYSAVLAKFKSTANNDQSIQTADPPAVVKWWHLKWIEVIPGGNTVGWNGGSMMRLGRDDPSLQSNKSLIPGPFWIEQIYMHGDKVKGQFRGIEYHANNGIIQDSYISDIKAQGQEGQAIWWSSFETGLTVTNNYLEASGETTLGGGSGGCCRHNIAVLDTPAPTINGATLVSTPTDLAIGQGMSVVVGGVEQYVEVVTISGNAITWTPALNAVPDVPGNVNYGLTPKNITFTKNYITKQISWRNPIVGTPQSVSASPNETGGTLAAGTYAYRVVARHGTAQGQTARSTASAEATATILGSTGSVTITWTAVTNAENYDIYGRTAGGENVKFSVTAPTVTFTDTGAAGTAAAVPTTTGSVWTVKNTLEVKNADTVLIEGNVIENSWVQAQRGSLVLLTPANTGNANDSTTVRNVTVRNNIFRHATGVFQVTCRDVNFTIGPSGRTVNMTFTNNLSYDIDPSYGQADRIFYIAKGAAGAFPTANTTEPNSVACKDVTVDHNTWDQSTRQNSFLFLDDLYGGVDRKNEHFVWTNNITVKGSYGMLGAGACVQGTNCWTRFTDSTLTSVFNKNVMSDAACSAYPGTNFCPANAGLQGNFVNYTARDYRLISTSPYHNAATDGTDIGANIPAITAFTDIATSGDNTGAPPVAPPTIQTTSLPAGTVSVAYTTTLTAANCGGGCTWSLQSGSLIAGLTLSSSGIISGVPTAAGTASFTVQAVTGGRTGTKDFTLIIANAPVPAGPPDVRPTRVDFVENGIFLRDTEPTVDLDRVRFGDAWIDTNARVWKWLYDTAPGPVWAEFIQKVNGSAIASLGASGTPSNTTYLRGDNTWATPAGGGTATVPFVNLLFHTISGTYANWSMPINTLQEFQNSRRNRITFDLTGYTQCRLYDVQNAGATGGTMWVQYSTNAGSTWSDLGTTASTPVVDLSIITGMQVGAWVNIATGAKTDVQLRPVGIAPTAQTPSFGNIGMNCK